MSNLPKRQMRRLVWYPALQYLASRPFACAKLREILSRDEFPQLTSWDMSQVLQRLRVRGWVRHDGDNWNITESGRRELDVVNLPVKFAN